MGRNDAHLTGQQRKLIEDNEALLYYFFHRYRRKFSGEDDAELLEIIFLAAVKAAKEYAPERGRWSTLLGHAVEMELRKSYRQKSAAMRSGYETVHWKDDSDLEYMLGETAALPDISEQVVSPSGVFWERAMAFLKPKPRAAMELVYGQGLTYAQAGEKLGVSHQAVHNMVNLAIKRIRKAIASNKLYCEYAPEK